MTGKKMTAKRTTAGAAGTKKKAKPATRSISDRAAEVDANIGRSQPLREFLKEAGWY